MSPPAARQLVSAQLGTMTHMSSDEYFKVEVRFKDISGYPHSETPWATRESGNSGGGTYRLANDMVLAPLTRGDLVRCQLNADSSLQVTAVLDLASIFVAVVILPDPDAGPSAKMSLAEAGAEVTQMNPLLVLARAPAPEKTIAALVELVEQGVVHNWEVTRAPGQPANLVDIDFELQSIPTRATPTTNYWAPDDTVWVARGMDSPDWLAFVQTLAQCDARVANALENGRHEEVIRFVERSQAIAAGQEVELLERPIFSEDQFREEGC